MPEEALEEHSAQECFLATDDSFAVDHEHRQKAKGKLVAFERVASLKLSTQHNDGSTAASYGKIGSSVACQIWQRYVTSSRASLSQ